MKTSLKLLTASLMVVGLVGCSTHSDRLGFAGDKEGSMNYAQAYEPARQMLVSGDLTGLRSKLLENDKDRHGKPISDEDQKEKLIKNSSELAILEKALLALNAGDPYRARFYFDAAEEKAEQDEHKGTFAKIGSFGKSAGAAITGAEELRNYELRGFEKVMLLNYKSLTYLLTGDYEKAYNVARRAIDTQQEEYEKFQKELDKLEEEKDEVRDSGKLTGEKKADTAQLVKVINGTFTKEQLAKATQVKSAYVNPFGDYMDGMILEIDSTAASGTDMGSVKRAYKKAYDLNKNCVACKEGESAKESGIPKGMKVVQVILADGFAPSRVEKTQEIKTKNYSGGVNYADLQLHPTKLHRATASIGGHTKQLSSLTKMESLIARDELDRLPWRRAMMIAAILKQTAAAAGKEIGAQKGNEGLALTATLLGAVTKATQHADTRSWMSLPNQIFVARLIVPEHQKTVTLITYGAGGKKLASRQIQLPGTASTVVYATSYDGQLNVAEAQEKKDNLQAS